MTLDIIIPTYNEYDNLCRLIPYLLDHIDNSNTQIIVVDADSSDDNSACLFEDFNIEYYKTDKTCRASQLNYGAQLSTADCLFFLHADVIPPKDFIAQIKDNLKTYDYGIFSYEFSPSTLLLGINARATRKKSILSGGGDQGLFIKRTLFNQVGGYNESQVIMEDFELFSRLKSLSDYALVQKPVTVSSRKYEENSWLRVNLVNLVAFSLFYIGSSPRVIKDFCQRWLRSKETC